MCCGQGSDEQILTIYTVMYLAIARVPSTALRHRARLTNGKIILVYQK